MTREQQEKVLEILKGILFSEGAEIDDEGWVSKDADVYTDDIDALREQGARIYYRRDREQMRISNWNPNIMKEAEKEPEKPKESATRMEVRGFRDRARIELVKDPDDQYTYHHDDIHIVVDGKDLGYMHIWNDSLSWWPTDRETYGNQNQTLQLTSKC